MCGRGDGGDKEPSSSPGHEVFGLLCASQLIDNVPGLHETEQAAEVKVMAGDSVPVGSHLKAELSRVSKLLL